jgi:hypothetical protein
MSDAERKQLEHDARQMGKTQLQLRKAAEVVFLLTPTRITIMPPADPKAAERAERYIWSQIGCTQESDWRRAE